jgi:hypothetical protein
MLSILEESFSAQGTVNTMARCLVTIAISFSFHLLEVQKCRVAIKTLMR